MKYIQCCFIEASLQISVFQYLVVTQITKVLKQCKVAKSDFNTSENAIVEKKFLQLKHFWNSKVFLIKIFCIFNYMYSYNLYNEYSIYSIKYHILYFIKYNILYILSVKFEILSLLRNGYFEVIIF